jgi:Taurine catabolism dioxygenase TauD, TfdA family
MTATTTPIKLDIAPLSGTIGAELRGVDLHQPLSEGTVAAIRQALLDYKVVFFPAAHLSPDEPKHFATYFGDITNAHSRRDDDGIEDGTEWWCPYEGDVDVPLVATPPRMIASRDPGLPGTNPLRSRPTTERGQP